MAWDIEALRKALRGKLADAKPSLRCIDSLARSEELFLYNMMTARDAMEGIVDDDDPSTVRALSLVLGQSDDYPEYARAKIRSEAHIIATVLTARWMADIFASLVNSVILRNKLKDEDCYISSVNKKLPPGPLSSELTALVNSPNYSYVSDFCNVIKHRYLVEHGYYVSFVGEPSGIRLGAFSYKDRHHPVASRKEVLLSAIDVKNGVVACGNRLNEALGIA